MSTCWQSSCYYFFMSKPTEPSYEQSIYAIHNRLFFRLFQVGNTLDRQTTKELGITTVQWAVLGALSRPQATEGMSFSELAEYLVVSRQSLDGVLKRLERDSHVKRIPDPNDGRAKKVMLTANGRQFWNSLLPKIYEFYGQVMKDFRFDDKVAVVHFLNLTHQGLLNVSLPASSNGKKKS